MRYLSNKRKHLLCLAVVLLLSGCAGFQEKPAILQGDDRIEMKADNFSFDPNSIQTTAGELEISLHNTSDTAHNITIVDPQKKVLLSRDIEPREKEQVMVSLDQPGTYEFYCDKRFHPSLGMKGEIEVAAR
jgi:plastocyanin